MPLFLYVENKLNVRERTFFSEISSMPVLCIYIAAQFIGFSLGYDDKKTEKTSKKVLTNQKNMI